MFDWLISCGIFFENCHKLIYFTYHLSDGITHRGCLSPEQEATACDESNQCTQCYTSKCNGNIRPSIRINLFENDLKDPKQNQPEPLSCIVCDSNVDPACKSNPNLDSVEECPSPSKCYHYINATSGDTVRGTYIQYELYFIGELTIYCNNKKLSVKHHVYHRLHT